MRCRHCSSKLTHVFLDLGFAPPSNSYLTSVDLKTPEKYYPLRVLVCDSCWLVQTEDYADAHHLFSSEYAYFSSTSSTWLEHAKLYVEKISRELNLNQESLVVEIASNDGYLLRNFIEKRVPCFGIEPTKSTATVAQRLGIPVISEFFGYEFAKHFVRNNGQADLLIGNNVYAHVPDINDFTRGLKAALKPGGTITLEFPHLMRLIDLCQFDTIYHEHFSYLSLHTVVMIFKSCGLRVWNVEEIPTHGGSLRVYGCHDSDNRESFRIVADILRQERDFGLQQISVYKHFQKRVEEIKYNFIKFLIEKKVLGKIVAAYGAAAKGNTLLNYAGVKPDLLSFVCDAAPAKQGKFMPGSHIPILEPNHLFTTPIDYLIVLPWNIADEITDTYRELMKSGTRFLVTIPELKFL